jgi:hypothetical protein
MICAGMTKDEVLQSWGYPEEVNTSVGQYIGVQEQWIYGKLPNWKLLYFENGKLTSWQD